MKRMHLHIAVADLPQSITFYSTLFGAPPTVAKPDYAKWMLDDPRVNFAISARGAVPGMDHIGIQAESEAELAEIKARLDQAELATLTEAGTVCCYAKSDKHWVQDPSGIAWETYHTLESAPTFNDSQTSSDASQACCAPAPQKVAFIARSKP
ncbi:ArsI/CadI family heavy metal resistance metalloenzyme [Methylophilus aquaticus]|uniref:ArsI/CadI family heavy metal resistance metalloenzyme n=1 Tax=Methylophilus aquaticus TaxID=1971610 RepID=A0ABT9JR62_9PROT|nr:ArsI/CadI family heavy metal resistance metalloenzyme [Methylophilus aquaticus]MDP8567067.1 ArsI/CadI family heavy metal resistance metalloenzyme [Methylophilus aquaticus]